MPGSPQTGGKREDKKKINPDTALYSLLSEKDAHSLSEKKGGRTNLVPTSFWPSGFTRKKKGREKKTRSRRKERDFSLRKCYPCLRGEGKKKKGGVS